MLTKKGNDSVCMCRFSLQTLAMTVESYFYEDNVLDAIDPIDRTLGIQANLTRVDIYNRFEFSTSQISKLALKVKFYFNQRFLICNFTRLNNIGTAKALTGTFYSRFYDINKPYYLFVASGPTNSLGSPILIPFSQQSNNALQYFNTTIAATNDIILHNRGFFKYDIYSLEWTNYEATTFFEFNVYTNNPVNFWAAFAFSDDQMMGHDDVNVCLYSASFGTVQHYFNNGNQPNLLNSSDPYVGYSDISVSYADGVLTCSFTRIKNLNIPNYAALDKNSYYLLFAHATFSINNVPQLIDNTTNLPPVGPVPISGLDTYF